MRNITIRLDDITPTMNWDNFAALDEIFTRCQVYPLLGIVPDNQDEKLNVGEPRADFWEYMLSLEKKGYTLAQHGYQHRYTTKDSGLLGINAYSEFAGESRREQEVRIRRGKELLESHGIYTDIFMAPAHSFDENTLAVLADTGFTRVTDGYTNKPCRYRGLIFYPSTISSPGKGMQTDTICLHPNHMTGKSIRALEAYLTAHREEVKSYGTMLETAPVRGCTPLTRLQVRKNLWIRELKYFVAADPKAAAMMQATNDSNRVRKMLKRLLRGPGLVAAFCRSRGK